MYSTSKYGFHHLSLEVLNMNQRILLEVQGKNRLYQLFDNSFNIHAISCTPEYGLWRSFIGGAGHESVYFSWRCRLKSWFWWLFEHFMHTTSTFTIFFGGAEQESAYFHGGVGKILTLTTLWRPFEQKFKFSSSFCQRPYHIEYTSSRPITEVKQCWA